MEKELAGLATQVPVALAIVYFIGREINALAKRMDEHNQTMYQLVETNQKVLVDVTAAVTKLCTLIEKYPIKCPNEKDTRAA